VHHSPGQFPVSQFGVLAGIGEDGPLLLGERLVRWYGLGWLGGPVPGPRLLLQPAVVAAASHPQRGPGPLDRPAAATLGQFHLLVHPLLELGRELTVVL